MVYIVSICFFCCIKKHYDNNPTTFNFILQKSGRHINLIAQLTIMIRGEKSENEKKNHCNMDYIAINSNTN